MRKKNIVKILLCIFSFAAVGLLITFASSIIKLREQSVQTYIQNRYDDNLKILQRTGTIIDAEYTVTTNDEYGIIFELRSWLGGYSTPWGTIKFIPQVHYRDNFASAIVEYVCCEKNVIDCEGSSIEEIISLVKMQYSKVQVLYNYYNITWLKPSIRMTIHHNNRTRIIEYTGQDDNILRDSLINNFYG